MDLADLEMQVRMDQASKRLQEATRELDEACREMAEAWDRVMVNKKELDWAIYAWSRQN